MNRVEKKSQLCPAWSVPYSGQISWIVEYLNSKMSSLKNSFILGIRMLESIYESTSNWFCWNVWKCCRNLTQNVCCPWLSYSETCCRKLNQNARYYNWIRSYFGNILYVVVIWNNDVVIWNKSMLSWSKQNLWLSWSETKYWLSWSETCCRDLKQYACCRDLKLFPNCWGRWYAHTHTHTHTHTP